MKGDFTRFTFDPNKHYAGVLKQQGRVDLDADWNEHVEIEAYLDQAEGRDVIGPCGVPKESPGFEITMGTGSQDDLTISSGHLYVDGILCELEEETSYLAQDDYYYPDPPKLNPSTGERTDLVYLDMWQRHITAIEDPDIQEVALGGPDTATRIQTVWQVKVEEDVQATGCGNITGWPPSPGTGLLSTQVTPQQTPTDLCLIKPGGGYQGLENRLYRVEIHDDGSGSSTATFKWSRDNGAVAFPVERIEGKKVKLKRLGRDQILTLHAGDWVEVLGDETELRGNHGTLAQVALSGVDEAKQELTLSTDVSTHAGESHVKVRRWDQQETSTISLISGAVPVQEGQWVELEDGVEIRFKSGGTYQSGDYWVFAARNATGKVEELDETERWGIEHHYCPLALITWKTTGRALVYFADGKALPDLAKAWTVSADGLVWTLELVQDAQLPSGVDFYADVALELLSAKFTDYKELEKVDDYTIQIVLSGPDQNLLEKLSKIILIEGTITPHVEDCRHLFPPLTAITADDVSYTNSACNKTQAETVQKAIDDLCQYQYSATEISFTDDICKMGAQNVQEALNILCQRSSEECKCTCTVTLGVGGVDDLEQALNRLAESGAEAGCICIPAGDWPHNVQVDLNNKKRITIKGCGPASRVTYDGSDKFFILENTEKIHFKDFTVACTDSNATAFAIRGSNTDPVLEGCHVDASRGMVLEENYAVSGLVLRSSHFQASQQAVDARGNGTLTKVQVAGNTFEGSGLFFDPFPQGADVVAARNRISSRQTTAVKISIMESKAALTLTENQIDTSGATGISVEAMESEARLILEENQVMIAKDEPAVKVVGQGDNGEVHANANVFSSKTGVPVVTIGDKNSVPPAGTAHVLFSNNQVYTDQRPSNENCTVELNARRLVVMGNYVADQSSDWGDQPPGTSICLPEEPEAVTAIGNVTGNGVSSDPTENPPKVMIVNNAVFQ